MLATLNPDANRAQSLSLTEAEIALLLGESAAPGDDLNNAFLWGGAGQDTLDLRFDRGIDFFPEESERQAVVQLDFLANRIGTENFRRPVIDNQFTGEQLVYGVARLNDLNINTGAGSPGSGTEDAYLFGIEHVIGTSGDDQIFGDAKNNTFEGGGGADSLVGAEGIDTLSYANAVEGVRLNVTTNADRPFDEVTDPLLLQIEGDLNDAAGDVAIGFERVVGTDFDDVLNGGQAVPSRLGLVSTDVSSLYAPGTNVATRGYQENPNLDITLFGGAGDDDFALDLFGDVSVEGGSGDDQVVVAGHGHRVDLGEGNDRALFLGPDERLLYVDALTGETIGESNRDEINTLFFGGDGVDSVDLGFSQDPIERVILLDDRIIVEQAIDADLLTGLDSDIAARLQEILPRQIYEGFEILVSDPGGASIALSNLDPIVAEDRSLIVAEDRNDPIPIGIELNEEQMDLEFRLTGRPDGGRLVVLNDDGSVRNLGPTDKVDAVELQNLHFITSQRYDFDRGPVTFNVIGERDADGNVIKGAASIPPGRGVSLGIELPVDPEGGPLNVTVDEVPETGKVFFLRNIPSELEFGAPTPFEISVQPGDLITPEELADLRYRPDLDDTGSMGDFRYTVRDSSAFDATSIADVIEDRRDGAEGRDGVASQTIHIRVDPREDAPKSFDQIFVFSPGIVFDDQLEGEDPDGEAVAFELVSGPSRLQITQTDPVRMPGEGEEADFTRTFGGSRGELVLNADGSFDYTPESPDIFRDGDLFYETTFRYRVRESEGTGQGSDVHEVTLRVVNPDAQEILVVDPDDPNQQKNPDPGPGEEADTSLKPLGGQQTSDHIRGHAGRDEISGLAGEDTIEGFERTDLLSGGEDSDALFGGFGNDTLMGGEGADLLDGGNGSDSASYADAETGVRADLLGAVPATGDARGDVYVSIENLIGSDFNDQLRGDTGANRIDGGGNSDLLVGRQGDDTLNGEEGRDRLIGGAGVDLLNGGTGADTFLFAALSDTGNGPGNRDVIGDWENVDRIDLSRIDADTTRNGDQAFAFIGTAQFSDTAGELRLARQGSNDISIVIGDTDGDGVSDFQIELTGLQMLEEGNFLL